MWRDDEEQDAKASALEEIMDLMDSHLGERLKSSKKPAVVDVSVTKAEPLAEKEGEEMESDEVEGKKWPEIAEEEAEEDLGHEDEEPSEHDKAMIAALYKKFNR